ncbi:exo-beta-N-acetylmuramidase NamZ domain-containing protein [Jeongeupia wiesaeckerbachi]|uniref:exo-beta-N-acetylmuramidase NamZ domain-containing protein n=1 Tax=Jeongeupia wiesaeckerbachi TaxID=3051218 RepID=UPI003D8015AC
MLQLGIDRPEVFGPLLAGRRVGLIAGAASVDTAGRHSIDVLRAHADTYGYALTTLFSVEHGLRGQAEAGFGDADHVDARSGLPVISLYGQDETGRPRHHPDARALADVDVLVFDLQDVGVRFYTYTLSLHWLMESAAAHGKALVVLDRPNPNGDQVYGPVLERACVSAIGIDPLPLLHGLTVGELARMMAGEGWLNTPGGDDADWGARARRPLALHVVPLRAYTHAQRRGNSALPVAGPVRGDQRQYGPRLRCAA